LVGSVPDPEVAGKSLGADSPPNTGLKLQSRRKQSEGKIVFDETPQRTPQQVTAQVLTNIYGEEDWSTTIRKQR
jgi:hypothetical protein